MLLDGLLLVDKPAGITSFAVVRRVRKALRVKKVGHLGTLDPFATGLLPLALGEATKLTQFLMEEPKTYLARMRLGVETDTQDLSGRVVAESDRLPAPQDIYETFGTLVGEIDQVPPLYSAVHHQGVRLYKLARRGEQVQAPPRKVTVHSLAIQEVALPEVTFRVECSKGTYVRTLAHDLGRSLGCGAHLIGLTRLALGPFRLEEAIPLEVLENTASSDGLSGHLIPLAHCLPCFSAVQVNRLQARVMAQGRSLPWPDNGQAEGEKVRVVAEGSLVAVATVRCQGAGRVLTPVRVFNTKVNP